MRRKLRYTLTTIDEHLVLREPLRVLAVYDREGKRWIADAPKDNLMLCYGVGDTPEAALADYRLTIRELYDIEKYYAGKGGWERWRLINSVAWDSRLLHPDPIGGIQPDPQLDLLGWLFLLIPVAAVVAVFVAWVVR